MTPSVLVVDDNVVDCRLASGIVEKRLGLKAIQASNGREALALIATHRPRVVLTDLQMPEMNGLELVEAIRKNYPGIPVILMTAHGSEQIAAEALRKGAASYVPKKCSPRDLATTVENVLAAAELDERRRRVLECLAQSELHFRLSNEPKLVPPLIVQLQEQLVGLRLGDETGRIRIGVALEEATLNALYHGNLEIASDLRGSNDRAHQQLIEQRQRLSPYQDRTIHIQAKVSRSEAVYVIRDEGPGFDPSSLPDPTDPANLEMACGRGLLLIRTFMDEVRHNAAGNEITMIKRRDPVKGH